MPAIRKTTAIILGLCALFFAAGLLLAPPAEFAVAAILAAQAIAMFAGTILIWPKTAWRIPTELFAEPVIKERPKGPVPLRFGLGRYFPDLNLHRQ